METNSQERIQAVVRSDIKNKFEELYIESGANSKGEFINRLMERFQEPEKVIEKPIEIIKEVQKLIIKEVPAKLEDNQVLVNLTPIQKMVLLEAVDVRNHDNIEDDGSGDGEEIEIEEGQGDIILKDQNYFALSPSIREKFGNIFSPLVAHEPDRNMGKILINTFMYNVYKQYDLVPSFTRRQLRNIAEELKSKLDEKEKMREFVKNLSLEEKNKLFGDMLDKSEETTESKKEIEEIIES